MLIAKPGGASREGDSLAEIKERFGAAKRLLEAQTSLSAAIYKALCHGTRRTDI